MAIYLNFTNCSMTLLRRLGAYEHAYVTNVFVLIVSSSAIPTFFEMTKLSNILSKSAFFSNILSEYTPL